MAFRRRRGGFRRRRGRGYGRRRRGGFRRRGAVARPRRIGIRL